MGAVVTEVGVSFLYKIKHYRLLARGSRPWKQKKKEEFGMIEVGKQKKQM
jgi:hypothetical protein